MREELQKILEMQQEGKVTPEQATELILALAKNNMTQDVNETQQEDPGPAFERLNLGEFIAQAVQGALSGNLGTLRGKWGPARFKISDEDGDGNSANASKVDPPLGEDFQFTDNQFNLSNFNGACFDSDSNFSDNRVQASTLKGLVLEDGEVTDITFNGTLIDGVQILGAAVCDCRFNGSKLSEISVGDGSKWTDIRFNGVTFKSSEFTDCEWSDLSIHGTSILGSAFREVEFDDCELQGCSFENSKFENVQFSDGKLMKVQFRDCEIRNVNLEDFKLRDVDFSGQKIDGRKEFEAFLQRSK